MLKSSMFFTGYFHPGVFEVVGTPHLRSQLRTTSFDTFELAVELSAQSDPPCRIPIPYRLILFVLLHR